MVCFIIFSMKKVFVAQYDYQAKDPKDLSFSEGKAVNMVLQ